MTDENKVIAQRYRLLNRVGSGTGGVVWRARDERLDRLVAVKQLLPDPAEPGTDPFRTHVRAMREARVAAKLRHPNAVTVFDVVEDDGDPYVVMEFLAALTLTDILIEQGSLPPDSVAKLGMQIASALAAAHAEGILHRDVSPNNILITASGPAKIADFGISHVDGEGNMTGRGLVVGTPAYLAPEVAGGATPALPSDVFSLGAVLYTALEGRPPFGTGGNQLALLRRVADDEVTPPQHDGPLTPVLLELLRKDPDERPVMARAHELLSVLVDGPQEPSRPSTLPLPPPPPAPPTPPTPKTKTKFAVLTVAAVLVIAAMVLLGLSGRETPGSSTNADAQAPTTPTTPVPPSTASPTTVDESGCSARYKITNSWPGGQEVLMTVRNEGEARLDGWTVSWSLPSGQQVGNLWDGVLSGNTDPVTVVNANWNGKVETGGRTTFGMIVLAGEGGSAPKAVSCRPS